MPSEAPAGGAPWTVLGTLQWTADYFKRRHIHHPRAVAEVLLAHALHCERIDLYLHYDQPLHRDELTNFKTMIQRRVDREPEAYIIGEKEFWSLPLKVTPSVLIPRPETECLVETTLALLDAEQSARILELGTGSGAISVAIASERPGWRIWASDISWSAVEVARHNAAHLLERPDRIRFFVAPWLASLHPSALFDTIIANPPYIATSDIDALAPEIKHYEPLKALDGGPRGIRCLTEILEQAADHLVPGGYLILEIGHDQRREVEALVGSHQAYHDLVISKDYSGLDRVAQAKKKKP